MENKSFWFHYNKPQSKKEGRNVLTLHYDKQCHQVYSIDCRVPIKTRDRTSQPRCVLHGRGVVSINGKAATIERGVDREPAPKAVWLQDPEYRLSHFVNKQVNSLFYDPHPYWGEPVSIDLSAYGNQLTWRDVRRAANQAIKESGDYHHIFVEGFEFHNDGRLEMFTGS